MPGLPRGAGGQGTFDQTAGTTDIDGTVMVGDTTAGALNLAGGSFSVDGNLYVGYDAAGTLTQSAGSLDVTDNLYVSGDGYDGDPAGVGTLDLSGSGSVDADDVFVGYSGPGTLDQAGGTLAVMSYLALGGPSGAVGTHDFTGGAEPDPSQIVDVLQPAASGVAFDPEGTPYTLDLSATSNVGNNAITGWAVAWGDGDSSNPAGSATSASHSYTPVPASYSITSTATGGNKTYAGGTVALSVTDVPAQFNAIADQSVNTGSPLSLSIPFTYPGPIETHTAEISWGDGTFTQAAVNESNGVGTITASHTYQLHRTYTASVQATDNYGQVGQQTFNVTANYVAPTLSVTAPTAPVTSGQPVTLQLHDHGPETTGVTQWTVDWNDGSTTTINTATTPPNTSSSTDAVWDVSHTYAEAGDYWPAVTATDSVATYSVDCGDINVVPAPGFSQIAGTVSTVSSGNAPTPGRVILAADEWATTGAVPGNSSQFVQNIISFLQEDVSTPTHQFLAYSSDHGLSSSWLSGIFAAAGDTLTVSTSVPFDLAHLEQYDGVFLAGPVNSIAPDNNVLIDYVQAGGNVYLEGGTGDFGAAANESEAWSTFTNYFGLSFSQTFDDEPAYTDTITGTSPLFNGVTSLYEWGTSPIELANPDDRSSQIIEYSPSGYGEYAVYDPDASANQLVPVTAQVDADNHYGLFTGNADGSGLSFIGRNEVGPTGSPGAYNWSDAETWNFDMSSSQYIYGVAWDGSTGGAWFMGQFALPNGQTLTTNSGDWQYAYGGDDGEFDTPQGSDYDAVPVSTDVSSWIATADNSGGWMTPVAVGNGAPDGTTRVPEIGTNVDALWTTSFNTDYSSFIVFRAKLPSPQTIYPANSAATVTGLSGRTVYVDSNDNGQLDPGEPSTVTGAGGEYALTNVPAGNAIVREVLPTGWTQTQPTGGEGYDVTVAPGQQLKDYNFVTQLGTGTSNQPPTATFADSGQIYEGGSGSLAFTNVVGAGPITYAFSFNDNGTWDVTGSSPTATIPASYLVAPGTFKMEGEISNAFGSTTYTTTVEVKDVAPTPTISGGAPPYAAGTPVNLTGSSSGPGDDDAAQLDWSVTKNGVPFGSTGTGTSYSFTPDGNGTFIVSLLATNSEGDSGVASQTIQLGGATTPPGNQPPTIVTPAAASDQTATTVNLSVLAADDGGEANLTYTWSLVGPMPAPVTFSANDDNLAKTTSATFPTLGTYEFTVVATDTGGLSSGPSKVIVIINQVLRSVTISPQNIMLSLSNEGQQTTEQFTATAEDQFGDRMSQPQSFAWSVIGGGSIGANTGIYLAPTSGTSAVIVATTGRFAGSSTVTLFAPGTVSAFAESSNNITLSWNAVPTDSDGYFIFRGNSPDFQPAYTNEVGETASTSLEDDDVSPETTYYYKVIAGNSSGDETIVGLAAVSTPSAGTGQTFPAPRTLVAAGVNDLEILLTWTNTLTAFTPIAIQESTDMVNWFYVAQAPSLATAWLVRGCSNGGSGFLQEGTTYYFRIATYSARPGFQQSGWSPIASASVLPPSPLIDAGNDVVVVCGGQFGKLETLLSGITINTSGTGPILIGQTAAADTDGQIWADLVDEGYNAFLTADPGDGASYGANGMNGFLQMSDGERIYSTLNNDGSGRIFDEVEYEFSKGFDDLGLIGYSHGGGMIYNFSQRLWNDADTPSLARVIFADTIDAIQYGAGPDSLSQTAGWYDVLPLYISPAAIWGGFGFNYYEGNGNVVLHFLHGVWMTGAYNYPQYSNFSHGQMGHSAAINDSVESDVNSIFGMLSN